MSDPLTEIVGLLGPRADLSKVVIAAGPWAVCRSDDGRPFYAAVVDGACRLAVGGGDPVILRAGDFVLVPAAREFTASSLAPPPAGAETARVEIGPGVFRLGAPDGAPDARLLVGHCAFASRDAALLVSLLPGLVHVRGQGRLTTLVELVDGETRARRPGRDAVLARLLEVLLIEALRCAGAGPAAAPGLLRGLADDRVAAALRRMHADPTRAWTVAALAKVAAMSRSAFFERFRQEVGAAPMAYLLAWRMALAKDLLGRDGRAGEVAGRVGYSSASTFGVAFARYVGMTPGAYARGGGAAADVWLGAAHAGSLRRQISSASSVAKATQAASGTPAAAAGGSSRAAAAT